MLSGGGEGFDDDTDVDVSKGDYSPQKIIKQKASYLISTHESVNIYANNFFTLVSTLFNEISALHEQEHLNDDQSKQFSYAAGVACSFTFAIFWLVSIHKTHKQKLSASEQQKFFDDIKNQLNPWYRCFKACSFLGNSVGQSVVEFIFLIPGVSLLLGAYKGAIRAVVSSIFGIIAGIIGATFLAGGGDIRYTSNDTLFHIGKDGWGRYAKSGLSFGSLIGGAIGAIIGFCIPIPGGMAAGIAIGSAVGGVIGFVIMSVGVPLVNYFMSIFAPATPPPSKERLNELIQLEDKLAAEAKGEKPKKPGLPEHPNAIKNNNMRTKYMRSGLASGVMAGTLIGFFVGLIFPFPGATLLFMAIGSAVGAIAGAAVLSVYGDKISKWVSKDDLGYSSFDFGMATGGQMFLPLGNAFGFIPTLVGKTIEKLTDCLCAVTGLIGTALGALFDIVQGRKNQIEADDIFKTIDIDKILQQRQEQIPGLTRDDVIKSEKLKIRKIFENRAPLVAWSQRVGVFVTYGTIIGSGIGFLIGTAFGGPLVGAAIGLGVGALISGATGAAYGARIYELYIQASEWISNTLFTKSRPLTPPPSPQQSHDRQNSFTVTDLLKRMPSRNPLTPTPTPTAATDFSDEPPDVLPVKPAGKQSSVIPNSFLTGHHKLSPAESSTTQPEPLPAFS